MRFGHVRVFSDGAFKILRSFFESTFLLFDYAEPEEFASGNGPVFGEPERILPILLVTAQPC